MKSTYWYLSWVDKKGSATRSTTPSKTVWTWVLKCFIYQGIPPTKDSYRNQLRNYESWFFSSKFVFIWSNFFYLWKNKLQLDQILSVFWALIVYFLLNLRVLIYFISWSWIFSLTFALKICFDQANHSTVVELSTRPQFLIISHSF